MARLRYLWRAHAHTFQVQGDRIVPSGFPISALGKTKFAGALLIPNCLLVEAGGRALVVDPGPFLVGSYLRDRLREMGVDLEKLDAVVTHWHTDHTGALRYIAGRRLFVGKGEREAAHPGWWEWITRGFRVVEVDGGELLPGVRVVPTPGHTPGHISLLIEGKERVFVAGDLVPTREALENPRVARVVLAHNPDIVIPGHDREIRLT